MDVHMNMLQINGSLRSIKQLELGEIINQSNIIQKVRRNM